MDAFEDPSSCFKRAPVPAHHVTSTFRHNFSSTENVIPDVVSAQPVRAKLVQETVSTVKISTTDIQKTTITDKIGDNGSQSSTFLRSNTHSIKPEGDPDYLAWLAREEAKHLEASSLLAQQWEVKKKQNKWP